MTRVFNRKTALLFLSFLISVAAGARAQAAEITVLVNAFENQTADRSIDWIGEGLSALIVERLNAERELYVFGREERMAVFERIGIPETALLSRATTMKMAWDMGADVVISGTISGTHEDFGIDAQILNVGQSSLGPKFSARGRLDDLMALASSLASRMAKTLVPGSTVPDSDYASRPPIPRSAFEAYIKGLLVPDPLRTVEFLSDAIRLNPQYASAFYHLGRTHLMNMDHRLSISLLERVSPTALEYPYARFTLGLNYYNLGDFGKSAAIFSTLPESFDVLVNLGAALARGGDAAGAQLAWKRASDRDPFGSEPAFNTAWLLFTTGATDEARRGLEQFLQLHGRDAEALFVLGVAYERLGRRDDAQRTQAQAVRFSPRLERWMNQPLRDLTRLRAELDPTALRWPAGGDIWNESRLRRRAAGEDLAEWMDSIRDQVDSRPYGESLRELQDMARTFPGSPDIPLITGSIYERRGQYDQAAAEYQRSVRLKPNVEAHLMLARLYRSQNQIAPALRAVEEALKLEPNSQAAASLKAELDRPGATTPRRRR